MKCSVFLFVCFLSASVAALGSDQPNWNNWHYFRNFEVSHRYVPGLVRAEVPLSVFGHAQDSLADLRVIDANGAQVPSTLDQPQPQAAIVWRTGQLSDQGFVSGQYSQAILDVGTNPKPYDSVQIETSDYNFFTYAQVEASDDRSTWRIVRPRAPLFSFPEGTVKTVSFPQTQSRWLRVKLLTPDRPIRLMFAAVAQQRSTTPSKEALPAILQHNANSLAHQTWWQADFGVANVPASSVRFRIGPGMFQRTVSISASSDGINWQAIGTGAIVREPPSIAGPGPAESLTVDFDQGRGRYWRVAILNGDDPPLPLQAVVLYRDPVYIVFHAQVGESYRLVYGNSIALAPTYDLSQITTDQQRLSAPEIAVGPEAVDANYIDPNPLPWSEQHAWVLWSALGLTVFVLVALSLRALRQAAAP